MAYRRFIQAQRKTRETSLECDSIHEDIQKLMIEVKQIDAMLDQMASDIEKYRELLR